MPRDELYVMIAIVVALLIVLIYLYEKGNLNKFLPKSMQKNVVKATFLGRYGRSAETQQCLISDSKTGKVFNTCGFI